MKASMIHELMKDLHAATGQPYGEDLQDTPTWYLAELRHICTILVEGGQWNKPSPFNVNN